MQKGVLRNFAKFTQKHLCQSLFFNKVAGLRPATLLKKRPGTDVFTCEFCEISKNTSLDRTSLVAASELCALSIYINTLKKIRKEYCLFNYKNPLWKR